MVVYILLGIVFFALLAVLAWASEAIGEARASEDAAWRKAEQKIRENEWYYADQVALVESYERQIGSMREQLAQKQRVLDGIAEAEKRAVEGTEDEMRGECGHSA